MALAPQAETLDLEVGTDSTVDRVEVDTANGQPVSTPLEVQYDPQKANDDARRNIAYALLVLLIIVVAFALVAISIVNSQPLDSTNSTIRAEDAKTDAERLVSVLNIVFGPIVTLLGTATGFYFGSQARREEGQG